MDVIGHRRELRPAARLGSAARAMADGRDIRAPARRRDRAPPGGFAALLRRQAELQAEADGVMRDLRLRERLRALGPVAVIGSASSGLMVWRDLDVAVRCADPATDEVL